MPSVSGVRLFVADSGEWTELTTGDAAIVRVSAPDLQQARRTRAAIRSASQSEVILDVTVAVAGDFRSARRGLELARPDATVRYAGTVDGLAGLILDIELAGVADGVTLVPAAPEEDVRALGRDVLRRLELLSQARAS